MEHPFWRKQLPAQALYEDLLWSRPQNRSLAGKLLIVGGHAQGFSRPAEAYSLAEQAGIGTIRVLLPDVLRKTLGSKTFLGAEFGPSTPSGSFAVSTLSELLEHSAWADGVLFAGDLGRNSETAILLEKFLDKFLGPLIITCDAADYITATPHFILQRPNSLLVLSFSQLQKLAINIKFSQALTFNMDLLRLIEDLHELTKRYKISIITKHLDTILVAVDGTVVTTRTQTPLPLWRLKTATYASVWWLQNPSKTLEALTTAVHEILQ